MSLRDRLRHWLGVPEPVGKDDGETSRAVHALSRQLGELRGLLAYQADRTEQALHRAGWEGPEDVAQHEALQRALRVARGKGDVIAGPWTGEVGFELLYWIPFLTWLVDQGLDPKRLIVISRGGAAPWYRHLTTRYVDALELVSPDDFRERTAGKKKQYDMRRDLDRELVEKAAARFGAVNPEAVHPAVMFRLFGSFWRKRATTKLVDSFTAFRPLTPVQAAAGDLPAGVPSDYIAAKFYFSKAFPDNTANRRFVGELLQRVSRQAPVVLMSTTVRLDEHTDFQAEGQSGLFVVDAHAVPQQNLERQSRVICGARGFIGTYGGFSYLAPFYGVPSLSVFSRRYGFEPHHLELADRVFDQLLPGGFLALHRRAFDLVEPAVGRWMTQPRRSATAVETLERDAELEPAAT